MSHETAMLWAAFCAGGTVATLMCWVVAWIDWLHERRSAQESGGGA